MNFALLCVYLGDMAVKEIYKASVTFNEKSVERVFRAAYFTYDKLKVVLRAAAGLALIAAAVFLGLPTWAMVLCLIVGCWLFVALDFPSKVRAAGTVDALKGRSNLIHLRFTEFAVEVVEEKKRYKYENVDRLIADKEYLFLFFDRQTAVMVETKTLQPGDVSAFRNFIAGKTGKVWKTTSIFFMNYKELRQAIADQRSKKQ